LCIEQAAQAILNDHDRDRAMPDDLNPIAEPGHAPVYQVRLEGHLGGQWEGWFGGLAITREDNGDTLLTGPLVDQAALHGLLKKVRDLGLPLVSVSRLEPGADTALEA
jgi:hypothetical protein